MCSYTNVCACLRMYMFGYVFKQVNTFQCVLATNEFESFVLFLYPDDGIEWTTGDISGGTDGFGGDEAVAGISAGDGVNFITIPGSLTPSIININNTSNVGTPGVWIFKVGTGKYLYCVIVIMQSSSCL